LLFESVIPEVTCKIESAAIFKPDVFVSNASPALPPAGRKLLSLYMTMLEDYWLPRREGNRGTEITTLPAGQNLGELSDVNYFQNKLFQALNVPMSRLQPGQAGFNLGRSAEISRDEVKFTKFLLVSSVK